jgi:hypothetical protein
LQVPGNKNNAGAKIKIDRQTSVIRKSLGFSTGYVLKFYGCKTCVWSVLQNYKKSAPRLKEMVLVIFDRVVNFCN